MAQKQLRTQRLFEKANDCWRSPWRGRLTLLVLADPKNLRLSQGANAGHWPLLKQPLVTGTGCSAQSVLLAARSSVFNSFQLPQTIP